MDCLHAWLMYRKVTQISYADQLNIIPSHEVSGEQSIWVGATPGAYSNRYYELFVKLDIKLRGKNKKNRNKLNLGARKGQPEVDLAR